MDLTTNGVVITDAIKFVQTNKGKLTMATKQENTGKDSKEHGDDEEDEELEKKQNREPEVIEQEKTTNKIF